MKVKGYTYVTSIALISVIPFLWVIMLSLKANGEILNNPLSLPSEIVLEGYGNALKIAPLGQYLVNSVIIATVSTFLNIIISSMAAYATTRFEFKLKTPIVFMMSIALLLPITALIMPVYSIISFLGLYDTKLGLILVYTALDLPMSFFILRAFFLTIPKELEEAAFIDGSTFLQCYQRVILPLTSPGMITAGILHFIFCWNEFLYALTLTASHSARTVPLALNYFTSQFAFDYNAMFSAVVIIIFPSILIFVIFQEKIIEGLTAGAVKG
ncbi:carbohydrate ABC transporter permease [Sinanaerobacter chloroacetimidivorans]|jgi:raffinose/stachyose/melibiose transport system permease protein|uniref:Carbohydrate ABC transporter permease n=1 Tax=Sinanaerobacter chloroacetimidivorans TaxID=2818044 RepID=A0A8J8B058_9FIRM|nr:carbohydrate ABC transporter permease [Sinanaerobacter chloroacetimidivorans]MBR0596512.1 carbohydrate ABC transporter permease [Sinanaerobacter chloroacetimidivorans]